VIVTLPFLWRLCDDKSQGESVEDIKIQEASLCVLNCMI
jgi:hypothetical protein